jgi:hypothetical protein
MQHGWVHQSLAACPHLDQPAPDEAGQTEEVQDEDDVVHDLHD